MANCIHDQKWKDLIRVFIKLPTEFATEVYIASNQVKYLPGPYHSIMANQRVFAVGKDSISALGIVEEPEENLGLSLLSNLQGFRLVEEAQRLLNKKMLLMYSLATCMLEVS